MKNSDQSGNSTTRDGWEDDEGVAAVNVEHVVFLFLVGTYLISLLGGLTVKIGKDVLGTSSQQRPTRLEAPFLEEGPFRRRWRRDSMTKWDCSNCFCQGLWEPHWCKIFRPTSWGPVHWSKIQLGSFGNEDDPAFLRRHLPCLLVKFRLCLSMIKHNPQREGSLQLQQCYWAHVTCSTSW